MKERQKNIDKMELTRDDLLAELARIVTDEPTHHKLDAIKTLLKVNGWNEPSKLDINGGIPININIVNPNEGE